MSKEKSISTLIREYEFPSKTDKSKPKKCKKCGKEYVPIRKGYGEYTLYCESCKEHYKQRKKEEKRKAESCRYCGKPLSDEQIKHLRGLPFCSVECDIRFRIEQDKRVRENA
jgi:formylmethanofuran dehydrogenase subunit E